MAADPLESDPTIVPDPALTPDQAVVPDSTVVPVPEDAETVEVSGGKYVPLDALLKARHELKEAKGRAQEADALRQYAGQLEAVIRATPQPPQTTTPPPAAVADPDLVELAHSLDFYTREGQPDVARAEKHAAIIQRQATKIAQAMVKPLATQSHQERAALNYQRALATRAPDGRQPRPETLTWMWQNLPAELTADPRVAQTLPALALGLDVLSGGDPLPRSPAPPDREPVHTEASGGTGDVSRSRAVLSPLERAVSTNLGMTEEAYRAATKDFRPGRLNVLED